MVTYLAYVEVCLSGLVCHHIDRLTQKCIHSLADVLGGFWVSSVMNSAAADVFLCKWLSLSYSSVAVMKHHDQSNLKRHLIGGLPMVSKD